MHWAQRDEEDKKRFIEEAMHRPRLAALHLNSNESSRGSTISAYLPVIFLTHVAA
jgi:hypothetical protein